MSSWKQRINDIFRKGEEVSEDLTAQKMNIRFAEQNMREFFRKVVIPTYHDLKKEVEKYGRSVVVDVDDTGLYSASLTVYVPSGTDPEEQLEEFYFEIRGRAYQKAGFAFPEHANEDEPRIQKVEMVIRNGTISEHDIKDLTPDDIIESFVDEYSKWMNY